MRIISLVPSWTETLIESGIYPVGRTRFCVHPKLELENIPIVGGTKTANWELIKQLQPDLLILDQEENPKEFSEKGFSFWSSHVTDGKSLHRDLIDLARLLKSNELLKWADLCDRISSFKPNRPLLSNQLSILETWNNPQEKVTSKISPASEIENLKVAYMIWKDPWMSVTNETYIGFVLEKLGFEVVHWPETKSKYPEVQIDPREDLNYFFSSEPFPFGKKKNEVLQSEFSPGSKLFLVDGESYSWFGVRSLRFLQRALQIEDPK